MKRYKQLVGIAVALLLGGASPAVAADTFVDQQTGDDANACTSVQAPCATAQAGIDKAGAGDTVRVAPGEYSAPPTAIRIANGKSLVATGPAASTSLETLYVTSAAGTISGFTFVGDTSIDTNGAVRFTGGPATLEDNVVDAPAGLSTAVRIDFGSGAPVVRDNQFTDDGVGRTTALVHNSDDPSTIRDNSITGYWSGIDVDRGSPAISGNTMEQLHNVPGGDIGHALHVSAGGTKAPTIAGNVIRDPVSVGGANPVPSGISIGSDLNPAAPTTGATLRRNQVIDHRPGVAIRMSDGPVTLDGDLLVGSDAIQASENAPAPPGSTMGDFTATNVTVVGGSRAIVLQEVHATIDSSIVSDSIHDGSGTQTTCTITNSRGLDGTAPTGNGCGGADFSTAADPQFVDAAADDYHLRPTSPMINAGDPTDPGAGVLDSDGDPRALSPTCTGGTVRRDIGADEFSPDCTPPDTQISGSPVDDTLTNSRSANLVLASTEPGSTFECAANGVDFTACTSPLELDGLADGNHQLFVRATDAAGNVDPTPAIHGWRVDGTPPETQFDSGPADGATIDSRSATYVFSSESGASFECSLDGAAFAACASPLTISGLADGSHVLGVRARDAAGNADATPARRTLTVARPPDGPGPGPGPDPDADPDPVEEPRDERSPETTVTRVKVKKHKAVVRFTADEELASFECRLDRKRFRPCTSPKTYRKLEPGKHKFRVRATDSAGNVDPSAAGARVKVLG